MSTATKTKFDPSAKLDELEAAAAAVEERHQELSREHEEKRQVLEGPDANTPGLLDELRDLRVRDPAQFKPDGTPVGEDRQAPGSPDRRGWRPRAAGGRDRAHEAARR